MKRIVRAALALAVLASGAAVLSANPSQGGNVMQESTSILVGRWIFENAQIRIVDEVRADGAFHEVATSAQGSQEMNGRWKLEGNVLTVECDGNSAQSSVRFDGNDRILLTYANGTTVAMNRLGQAPAAPAAAPAARPAPERPAARPANASNAPAAAHAAPLPRLLLHRSWEPAQHAFTLLVPDGWQMKGGMFNVNALEMNGPGNSLIPKIDFTVESDAKGTVLIRWLPAWNYADLRATATAGFFQPGSNYNGMPVRYIETPQHFLSCLFPSLHPHATNVRVVGQDPMAELTQAFAKQYDSTNQALAQMGIPPLHFESLAVFYEYTEDGETYSEILFTTILDNRAGAGLWSNEQTLQMRAPKASSEQWKGVLDMIRNSIALNPEWVALIQKHSQIRANIALDTQRYLNRVSQEIADNRARTNDRINHENWLLLTGQEEYRNPYTGEVERGTNEYEHRWENANGDILYTNENAFDPNTVDALNSNEWKKSEVQPR